MGDDRRCPSQPTSRSRTVRTHHTCIVQNVPVSPPYNLLYSPPQRHVRAPLKYRNYVDSNTIINQLLQQDDREIAMQLSRTPHSLPNIFTEFQQNNTIMFSISDEEAKDPESVPEAQKSVYWNKWLIAMHDELESLKAKETYEPVDTIPPGRKAVQCKWVLHIKHDKNNSITWFKARLVAKGFTQIPGQDFTYTFAPVACWDSIHTLLSTTALNDYELRQLDMLRMDNMFSRFEITQKED